VAEDSSLLGCNAVPSSSRVKQRHHDPFKDQAPHPRRFESSTFKTLVYYQMNIST